MREAYEDARKIQVDLAVAREQEQNLRRQRNEKRCKKVVAQPGWYGCQGGTVGFGSVVEWFSTIWEIR